MVYSIDMIIWNLYIQKGVRRWVNSKTHCRICKRLYYDCKILEDCYMNCLTENDMLRRKLKKARIRRTIISPRTQSTQKFAVTDQEQQGI